MTTEEFIRSRAKMNWSKQMVADALEISPRNLGALLESMTGIDWCHPKQSADVRRSYAERRGVATPGLVMACETARAARRAKADKHNVAGYIGTTSEVFEAWRDCICVTYSTVRRRLAKGVNTLDAFFMPQQMKKGWGQNGKFWNNVSR
jgi:hypothetical protein